MVGLQHGNAPAFVQHVNLLNGQGRCASIVIPAMLACTGDKGLEIAPGKDVEENEELNVVGNAYNAVPVAKKWIPVDPRPGCITVSLYCLPLATVPPVSITCCYIHTDALCLASLWHSVQLPV